MNIWKTKFSRIWLIVSCVIVVLGIVVNIVASTVLYELFCLIFGRARPVYADGTVPMYVAQNASSKKEAFENANKKSVEICEEGFVLLKNENEALPLKNGAKVSVFGKNSVNLSVGGSGSSSFSDVTYKDLYASLSEAGFSTNPKLKAFYEDNNASGPKRAVNSSDLDSGSNQKIATGETPQSKYTADVKNSYSSYKDAAIVVITRIGGEGFDLPRYQGDSEGAVAPDSHYLELDKNERDLLTAVTSAGFDKVVVLFNIPSAFEATFLVDTSYLACADKIDACLWCGFCGGEGITAVGRVLKGDVTPSGKTVDTWSSDFSQDPTFVNFGTGSTPEGTDKYDFGDDSTFYFVCYEEGIYVGYRYYETRYATETNKNEWYANNVVYPFGYGLSYATFSWEVTDKSQINNKAISATEKYSISVKVKNTSSKYAGKDVVEVYARAPYTAGGIEKADKVLVGFAKTKLLAPGEEDTVTITVDPYSFASYDYRDANKNGFAGYELESGAYALVVGKNAHEEFATIPFSIASTYKFEEDPVTGNVVGNRFTKDNNVTDVDLTNTPDSDYQLSTILSRNDWTGTWPTAVTLEDRQQSKAFQRELRDTSPNNPIDYSEDEYPYFEEETDKTVRDLLPAETPEISTKAFVDYDNELWEELLNATVPSELIDMFDYAAYQTKAVMSIKMPATIHADGPAGWTCFMNKNIVNGTCHYCSEPIMASTWNYDLIKELGNVMGEEGLIGDGATPYSCIYSPGVNIHRSIFGGRCAEYFSEDPFLTGKMAAAEIIGCQERGALCTIKHFALNEQETHRSNYGDCSWVSEQAMREIFIKGFEIGIKESESRAIMTSFNRIGTRWTGGDYRLVTEILEGEWGFKGVVQCDFNTCPQYMNSKQMAYAGGDINLATTPVTWCDESDVADAIILRKAAKDTIYAMVNSNAMNGEVIGYKMPVWVILMIIVDCVLAVGIAVWGFFAVRKALAK